MIALIAHYHVQSGKSDQVLATLEKMAPLVAEHEPGCTLYHASRSNDDPDLIMLYETYVDDAAVQAHRETDHYQELIQGEIVPLLDKREVAFYTLAIH